MNLDGMNWSVVGYDGNQMPGDGDAVSQMSNRYKALRCSFESMSDSISNLQTMAGMNGEWVKKFADKVGPLEKDFRDFANGFGKVGKALDTWTTQIVTLQRKASNAFDDLDHALTAQASAQFNVEAGERASRSTSLAYDTLPDDVSDEYRQYAQDRRDDAQAMLDQYKSSLRTADGNVSHAKNAVVALVEEYKYESGRRAREIAHAMEVSPRLNGRLEHLQYSDAWQVTVTVLKVASIVLGVVALFFGGWIAVASGVVALLLFADKLIAYHNGDATLADAIVTGFWALLDGVAGFKALGQVVKATGVAKSVMKAAVKKGLGGEGSPIIAKIYKDTLRAHRWDPTKWGNRLLSVKKEGLRNVVAKGLRDGWKATLKAGRDLGNSARTLRRAVLKWKDTKKGAGFAQHVYDVDPYLAEAFFKGQKPMDMLDGFWAKQFSRIEGWSKGYVWALGDTVANIRTAYMDFKSIRTMKTLPDFALEHGKHISQWGHLSLVQQGGRYLNAAYDTAKVTEVAKPFIETPPDGGIRWKNDGKEYFKVLVPDPLRLWNVEKIGRAPVEIMEVVAR